MRSTVREAGFSLIELMVAMAITLIVSGSIYGLIANSQNSFRRDPEISERQQNIRVAIDRIRQDLSVAGMSMGAFVQVFTNGLDDAGDSSFPSQIVSGENSDILEFYGNDGLCPDAYVDTGNPTDGANINTVGTIPDCYPEPGMVFILFADGGVKKGWGHNIHAQNHKLNFPPGQQPAWSDIQANADLTNPALPVRLLNISLYRYAIGADVDGQPGLYRTTSGGIDGATGIVDDTPPGIGWILLARGVEDLQVQYRNGSGSWFDTPGTVTANDYATLVREVRVTLSARTTGGAGTGSDGRVIRGRMTTVVAPRATLTHLSTAPTPQWQ